MTLRWVTITALLLAAGTWVGCGGPRGETSSPMRGQGGIGSSRLPLGSLVYEVSVLTGRGFVLASPELHDLPISIFFPPEASTSQVVAMFDAALHAHGLQAVENNGYWLIGRTSPQHESSEVRLHATPAGVVMDLDRVRLALVTRAMSKLTGQRFILGPALADHLITIQALNPVPADVALALLVSTLELSGLSVARQGDLISIRRPPPPLHDDVDDLIMPSRPEEGRAGRQVPRLVP